MQKGNAYDFIDYIEVELANGETASLNWDESEIGRTGNGFSARYKGVCFGEAYANGRLDQLQDMKNRNSLSAFIARGPDMKL